MGKLTYKDFKIGQVIQCIKQNSDNYNGGDPDNERLILGEKYTITDIDLHFPDRICVKLKGPYYHHEEFVPIDCFNNIQHIREFKINQILSK